jgi:pyridoxal 5'-phosphate synthase pdxT subunit
MKMWAWIPMIFAELAAGSWLLVRSLRYVPSSAKVSVHRSLCVAANSGLDRRRRCRPILGTATYWTQCAIQRVEFHSTEFLGGTLSTIRRPRIGVLAIQGDYAAHAAALTETGADPVEVRNPEELETLDGLILPGGESTTMLKFLERRHFFDTLREFATQKPVFGTCAGCILLARKVIHPAQRSLGLLDAVVERNAYGRQIDSSILTAPTSLPGDLLEMVFIRAPRIAETGPGVEVLARRDGSPVLVRQGKLMAATFHPELSSDRRVHSLFVETVRELARSKR